MRRCGYRGGDFCLQQLQVDCPIRCQIDMPTGNLRVFQPNDLTRAKNQGLRRCQGFIAGDIVEIAGNDIDDDRLADRAFAQCLRQ